MILDEFRQSIATYSDMIRDGHDPIDLLNIVDKRIADISNHIAVCHRVIAEQRGLANNLLFWLARGKHLDKAASAARTLDETIELQQEFFSFRHKVLRLVADRLSNQSGRSTTSG